MKRKDNMFKEGLGASQLAERALAAVQDSNYRKRLERQLRRVGIAVLIAVLGLGVSLWQLLHSGATLSVQASQFWLLCLVLAGGLLGVAFLSGAGLLTTNFAMKRLALAKKDFDVFEATRQSEQMRGGVEVVCTLIQEINKEGNHELEVIVNSLSFILQAQGGEYQRWMDGNRAKPAGVISPSGGEMLRKQSIITQWRNMGVSDNELERLGAAI